MKMLITGGAGFIGSSLGDRWADRAEIVCLDNFDDFYDPAQKHRNIGALLEKPDFQLVEGDIRDESLLDSLFSEHRFDQVVHIAARGGVRPSIKNPLLYHDINVKGTLNLLDAMRRHEVRKMVFASSSSVYGISPEVPWSEENPVLKPISPYAATKVACELACYTHHHLYDLDITCLRFFTVYGPRQRPDMAIHKFARLMLAGEPIPMYGEGKTERDYTYIDDILEGVSAAMERDLGFEVINLGNSETVSLKDLVATIAGAVGVEPDVTVQPPQPGDVPITCADISKAARLLDYAPTTGIEAGVARFVEWLREQG